MIRKTTFVFGIFSLLFLGCKDKSVEADEYCPAVLPCTYINVVKAQQDFEDIPLIDAKISLIKNDGQYLILNVGANECDFHRTYTLNLSPNIEKTNPPQREAKLVFEDQNCEAYYYRNICIERSSIKDSTLLHIITPNGIVDIAIPSIN